MRKLGLRIQGAGGGSTHEGVKRLVGYTLGVPRIASMEEGRELIVTVVTTYLDILNSETGADHCLIEYPFPPERLNITIISDASPRDGINGVSSWKGSVNYFHKYPERSEQLHCLHEETFAEAKAIVEVENIKANDDGTRSSTPIPTPPPTTTPSPAPPTKTL